MAKNYSFAEAVNIIVTGSDLEAITDIGRRYPVLMNKVSVVGALAGFSFVDLMSYLPEHLTANKVNSAMKNAGGNTPAADDDDAETDDDTTETDEEPKEAKKTGDYESMSGKELWDLLGKAGKRKDCKEKMGGVKKDDMVAYIKKYGLGAEPAEEDEADEEVEETSSENPYDGKTAMELFKECKKRGIKAQPKKNAKFYADLLTKDDEKNNGDDADADEADDDWGDDEVEETPEKKTEKKTEKKAEKKKVESDDDDDWEI